MEDVPDTVKADMDIVFVDDVREAISCVMGAVDSSNG
jgi:ATP-dependent Lon protease